MLMMLLIYYILYMRNGKYRRYETRYWTPFISPRFRLTYPIIHQSGIQNATYMYLHIQKPSMKSNIKSEFWAVTPLIICGELPGETMAYNGGNWHENWLKLHNWDRFVTSCNLVTYWVILYLFSTEKNIILVYSSESSNYTPLIANRNIHKCSIWLLDDNVSTW